MVALELKWHCLHLDMAQASFTCGPQWAVDWG